MTLRLILTRHAKSDWGNPALDDHDRVLNPRGVVAAAAMGTWLAGQGHQPGQALVSTAKRAVETWDGMKTAFAAFPVMFESRLYHASPDTMLEILSQAQAPEVLMVGHNPGCAIFAGMMLEKAPDHPQFHAYPTAATTVIEWNVTDWGAVRPRTGRVVAFAVPREVMGK